LAAAVPPPLETATPRSGFKACERYPQVGTANRYQPSSGERCGGSLGCCVQCRRPATACGGTLWGFHAICATGFPGTHALAPTALHFVKPDGRSDAAAPAAPIPGAQKLPDTICASFAATGRGWRHPTFTCRRPAPGRRARWLEIQGPVPTGSGESASNGGGAEARLQWLKADAAVTGSDPRLSAGSQNSGVCARVLAPPKADGQRMARVTRRRGAGAERQPVAEGESPPLVAE